MVKKITWEWENIDTKTKRTKVMGGWLVHHTNSKSSESMIFIQDRDYEWCPSEPIVDQRATKADLAKDFCYK